ncbi:hypothetical protein [Gimesia sp.]|uniref:hypothetical protein n=1 Tax=Gimesia sp. TaxID=2024833 RepID=UPI003A939CAD
MQTEIAQNQFEFKSGNTTLIQRSIPLAMTVAILSLILITQNRAHATEKTSNPNIIYILADDKN